jgi:hypothetical protein
LYVNFVREVGDGKLEEVLFPASRDRRRMRSATRSSFEETQQEAVETAGTGFTRIPIAEKIFNHESPSAGFILPDCLFVNDMENTKRSHHGVTEATEMD